MVFRTLRAFWTSALASEMEYRLNFLVAALNALGYLAGSLFTVNLFYAKNSHAFGHWTRDQAFLVVALFTLMDGLSQTLLNPNLSRIVQHVQRGTLDFVLLKPLDAQIWLSLRNFSPWGVPSLLFALGLLFWSGARLNLPPTAYLVGLVPIALAVIILYSIWFAIGTTTIWFTKIWNATEVLRSFLESGRYPIAAYPPAFRVFFTFVLPVAFLTTIPADTMLGRAGAIWLLAELALALVLFTASRLFWKWALRSYTSASS